MWGPRQPDLLHVRPRRRPQRLFRRFPRRRPPGDLGVDRRVRCRTAPRWQPRRRRLPRPKLEHLSHSRRFGRPRGQVRLAEPAPAGKWSWEVPADTTTSLSARREPYRRRMTLDFAAGDAVVIPGYGGAQGIFFAASDLLGDNVLLGSLSSYQGRRLGSIFSNLSGDRGLHQPVASGELGHRRLPHQEPQLRRRPGRLLRRDRLRRRSACCAIRSRASRGSRPRWSSSTPTAWTSRCRWTSRAGSAGSPPTT